MKFRCKAKDLSSDLSLAEAGIIDNVNILVIQLDVVFYRKEDDKVKISCRLVENVSSIIEGYRSLFGDYKPIIKFILNAKNLSPILSAVVEAGITINAYIFVVYPK